MSNFDVTFAPINYHFPLIHVEGTNGTPFLFGGENHKHEINVRDFFISKFLVTQELWEFVMGKNPAHFKGKNRPVEHVSYENIVSEGSFLEKLNEMHAIRKLIPEGFSFRLPTESEWEYAARGGKNWKDGFQFSGSNDMNEVGWYEMNSGIYSDPVIIAKLKNHEKGTQTHDVGGKAPNQLGIHDMCGNVWEWCQDYSQPDISKIPADGTPCLTESTDRVLRGGCHHNGVVHCTVHKRYHILPKAADECIGFRIVASA